MKLQTPKFKTNDLRFVFVLLVIWYLLGMLSALFGATASSDERNLRVQIVPQFNGRPLEFEKLSLTNAAGQIFSVTRLDFLLSDFALRRSDGSWLEQTNRQAFLSPGQNRSSFVVEKIPAGNYGRIRFHIGLRPEINHSKPEQYPANHPLNPVLNGLHWGWAGGYVFAAIEGNWRTDAGEVSGYSFHLGNDPMLMSVEIPAELKLTSDQSLQLALNLDRVLDFKLSNENSSTHSRKGDEFAEQLRNKVERALSISSEGGVPRRPNSKTQNSQGVVELRPPKTLATPYRFTISSQFPIPDLPRDNPLTEEGVELGHRLFDEKLLSINGKQSCASCHVEENAFSDPGKKYSVGAEGAVGTRNAMPIFNLAWKKNFFWDGRAATLREQVLMPIQNPIEMHETLERAVAKLAQTRFYPAEFEKVFGSREITADKIARALEQFVITRVSSNSKFDRAMDGREELTEQEKRGFQLFVTEYDPRREQFGADCFHCHGGPLFQSQTFANNGLDSDPPKLCRICDKVWCEHRDLGRAKVTGKDSHKGKFSVPSLRNVAVTAPYMHDGRFKTLEEVVEHYSGGVQHSDTLDPNLAKHPDTGIRLSDADKRALVAFLKTLTDEKFKDSTIQFANTH